MSENLYGQFNFDRSALAPRDDWVRLGPLAITATTSGAAQTLFTVDDDTQINMGRFTFLNTTGGALTINVMIDSTVIMSDSIAANATETYDFGSLAVYSAEVVKAYASAAGITVTAAALRETI